MRGLSLRYKILAALTLIPLAGLTLFLLLAVTIFERDKIAYVYDASMSVSKTRAARVSSEVSSVVSIAQAIVLSYRADTKNLAETGTYYFDRESKFQAFQIFAVDASGGYERVVDLAKTSGRKAVEGREKEFLSLVSKTKTSEVAVVGSDAGPDQLLLAARFGEVSDPRHVVAIALFEASELAQVFTARGPYLGFLASKVDGRPLFMTEMDERGWGPDKIWSQLAKRKLPEGIEQLTAPSESQYLASFIDTGVADLVVVSMVKKTAALQAVDVLLKKSVLFFMAVISLTTIFAVLAARSLTFALRRLSQATAKIAEGDFDVRISESSGGEIGLLASGFNSMATEVSRLMKETAEKARMESELATAKAVQETLFPESHAKIGSIEISGHYVPASECGGDWWYYCENQDKVYIWIGDATGHGAPAALLTSAARAVASVITFGPARSCSESLGILNRAICETSKGKMMMTFFLACIDKQTGEMTYANASHEPPLLLHKLDGEAKRDDFIPLNAVNNPRLGEQADRAFKEATVQLQPGDRIVFYTDGVIDVKSPEQKNWGERRFLKSLASHLAPANGTDQALSGVVEQLDSFRANTPLDDDVTLVLCRFDDIGRGAA